MQKYVPSLQNYFETNCPSVAPMLCLKVILRTRDIVRWRFPDSPLWYGRYIPAVFVFQWFFLQLTQRASLYYFRRLFTMWFLSHLFYPHELLRMLRLYIFSSWWLRMKIAEEIARNNDMKVCTKRYLFVDR